MKTMFLSVVLVTVASAVSPEATVHPNFGSAFRSDATLRFMRGTRRADPVPSVPSAEEASEAVQSGPAADSKKAQEAAAKVVEQAKKDEKAAAKEPTPIEAAAGAVADAAETVTDALAGDGEKPKEKAAPKEGEDKSSEPAAEQPEDLEVKSVPGCKNTPKGWADSKGNDCEDYAEGQWCNRHGGYGDAWLDEWGTFENRSAKGKSALQVCCVCGGGLREEEAGAPGAAPSPAAAGAPGPAPMGPILGTKAGRPMQSQGYSGSLVIHVDQQTMTDDWGQEFGPQAGHRDVKTICQDHPGNEWCLLHGYYDKESGAVSLTAPVAIFFAVLACWS